MYLFLLPLTSKVPDFETLDSQKAHLKSTSMLKISIVSTTKPHKGLF